MKYRGKPTALTAIFSFLFMLLLSPGISRAQGYLTCGRSEVSAKWLAQGHPAKRSPHEHTGPACGSQWAEGIRPTKH